MAAIIQQAPDFVLEQIFSFLEWKALLRNVDQVCKRWRNVTVESGDGALWLSLCEQKMKFYNGWIKREEHEQDGTHLPWRYRVMAQDLQAEPRRPYRDIFLFSERAEHALHYHEDYGPDARRGGDRLTTRERVLDDLRVVLPTIKRLKTIFEPGQNAHTSTEHQQLQSRKSAILQELLKIARADPNREFMLKREPPHKSDVDEASRQFGFEPLVKLRKRAFPKPLCEMDWPLNAHSTLTLMLDEVWPDAETNFGTEEELHDGAQKWWKSLNETTRLFCYEEYCKPGRVPDDIDTLSIQRDVVILMFADVHSKAVVESRLWCEYLDDDVKSSLAYIFKNKCDDFASAISSAYSNVYQPDYPVSDAKLLLEIFLRVPQTSKRPKLDFSDDHIECLEGILESAMLRWNVIVKAGKNDNAVLRNHETLVELESLASKFARRIHWPYAGEPGEYVVGYWLHRFMEECLSTDTVPEYIELYNRVKSSKEKLEKLNSIGLSNFSDEEQQTAVEPWTDIVADYKSLRDSIHTREHAMLALIPLLAHLSTKDSKKLVYALFVQQTNKEQRSPFSEKHFGQYSFSHGIPCTNEEEFDDTLHEAVSLIDRFGHKSEHRVIHRLFGLALPRNIAGSMVGYLVDSLYQDGYPHDVNMEKCDNACSVLPYLKRYVVENPEDAGLVFDAFQQVIENAIQIHSWEDNSGVRLNAAARNVYTELIFRILAACIATRAVSVAPSIRKIYQGRAFENLTRNLLGPDSILQRIGVNDEMPSTVLNEP